MARRPTSNVKVHAGSWSTSESSPRRPLRLAHLRRVGPKRTATSAKTVLAIAGAGVSLSSKVANQNFTAPPRMTAMSAGRRAENYKAGYLPATGVAGKSPSRELCRCLYGLSQPLAPDGAEAAGEPMRPATLDKSKHAPKSSSRERQAPALQIELELPLVAPDANLPVRPAPGGDPLLDRGIAVIDFYI